VQSITFSPNDPEVNQSIVFTVTVKNQGLTDAPADWALDLFSDEIPSGCGEYSDYFAYGGSIPAGETQQLVINHDGFIEAGSHYVSASVDSECFIEESYEDNNIFGPVDITVHAGGSISGHVFKADGSTVIDDAVINVITGLAPRTYKVEVSTLSGAFNPSGYIDYMDIYYAGYDTDGNLVKAVTQHTSDTGNTEGNYNPSLASLTNNRILLVHQHTNDTDGSNLYYTILSSAGTTVKSTTNLTSDSKVTWDWISDAVELSDGRILVAWMDDISKRICFAVLGPAPTYSILYGPTELSNPFSDFDAYMSVTADASGNGVITWMDYDYTNRKYLFYSLVNSDGTVVNPPMIFRSSQDSDPYIYTDFEGYGNTSYLYEHALPTIPTNDPMGNQLWALHNWGQTGGTTDADIDAKEAWETITGTNEVVVAVIDSGIDYTHEDLAANMWQNPLDCNTNGSDDDGNGYIDDCYGIDTYNGDTDPMDDNSHGTHCAGTIGAVGDNGKGVVGVNWQVDIIACKFLPASGGGLTSGAVECLDYLAGLYDSGVNLVATNNSWGGGGYSQALSDAIEAHHQRGILFIAAAGNSTSNNDYYSFYPSSYDSPNVLSIASTDHNDDMSSFSSYGSTTVDIGAPGSSILSTLPGDGYGMKSGTSMATPHTTGVAALLKSANAALDWIALKNLLISSGDPITALSTNTVSGRRLNANNGLTCSGQTVLARLQPEKGKFGLISMAGVSVNLAMLHINCADPNGTIDVTVTPGVDTITLYDNGLGTDQAAGDGIYSGQYELPVEGTYTFDFPDDSQVEIYPAMPYSVEPTPYDWRTISSVNLDLSNDEQGIITPPFPIHFGGGVFDEVYVEDNGAISFNPTRVGYYNVSMAASHLEAAVAPFWDDLYPMSGSDKNVFYDVQGTSPDRELVIEWRDMMTWDCRTEMTTTVTFQAVFFENSSDILFNYQDVLFGGSCSSMDYGGSATVGVQVTNTDGTQYSYNTTSLTNNKSLLWSVDRHFVYLPLIIRDGVEEVDTD